MRYNRKKKNKTEKKQKVYLYAEKHLQHRVVPPV